MKNFIKFININMKKFPYTSILGWSSSRYDVFSTCNRKYYYRYYAKHDADFKLDQINRLKQLTTIPLTIGSIAHDVIETLLKRLQKSDSDIDASRLKEHIAKMVEDTIQKSEFFEIYYQKQEELDKEAMVDAIYKFANQWLPKFIREGRVILTISIGCTGGQHRSVYLVEQLNRKFKNDYRTLVRHRDLT